MSKIIIFDFNWTLYDPDRDSLVPGSVETLSVLKSKGFLLYLLSNASGDKEHRKKLIKNLGLEDFFVEIVVSEKKCLNDFESMIDSRVEREASYVIGDRVEREIFFGNVYNLNTIWFKRGKFASVYPVNNQQKPSFIINDLMDVLNLIS